MTLKFTINPFYVKREVTEPFQVYKIHMQAMIRLFEWPENVPREEKIDIFIKKKTNLVS